MEVYCWKQPILPYQMSNSTQDVVLWLSEPVFGSGRSLTVQHIFCSIPLANKLAEDYKLSLVGPLVKEQRELPNMSVYTLYKECQVYSSLFV